MRFERRPGYRALVGGPVPPGADAITIGPVVSIRARAAGHRRLELHEAVHVRQWRTLGWFRFAARYAWEYALGRLVGRTHESAYRHLSAECEAEWEARRRERDLSIR